MKIGKYRLAILILAGMLWLGAPPPAFSLPSNAFTFENLTADIGRGFGSTWNRYAFSMEELNGQVYVGTWNVQFDYPGLFEAISSGSLDLSSGNPLEGIGLLASEGAEIWRHDGGQNWTQVHKATSDNTGFRKMVLYQDQLYATTANSENGTQIWRSDDGVNWMQVPGGPSTNPANNSTRAATVFEDRLIIGTENNDTGGELWAYDGGSWEQLKVFSEDSAVSEVVVYNDKMYVGTWDFTDRFQFFASENGEDFTNVTPVFPGSDSLNNLGVMKLIEFDGKLFLGTVNYVDGFTMLSSDNPDDPNGWTVITTDGMGDKDNAYMWSSVVWQDALLVGTFNSGLYGGIYDPLFLPLDGRAQLLYSTDGSLWDTAVDDGFDKFNYGFRSMLVSNDQLFVGTASNFFIPDLHSSLYADLWANLDPSLLAHADWGRLSNCLAGLGSYSGQPFIGTQIYATAPVPEPATILLLGSGLVGIAGYRRRKPRR